MKRTDRTASGFTLLEVLGAVAILGIWFTVLASVAIQGLRAEGQNERLLRASLLADSTITDLESILADGEFPELGVTESEIDEFIVESEATLFAETEFGTAEFDLNTLLEELPGIAKDLYAIQVRVRWFEGNDEVEIQRSTYAWDAREFNAALEANPGASGEDGGEAGPSAEDVSNLLDAAGIGGNGE